jgi:multiple sugar transport system substrate-binding protein
VYNVGAQTAGELMAAGDVLEVPKSLRSRLYLSGIPPIYNKYQLQWNGKLYGIPFDGDMMTMYYRRDLIDNPSYQAAFKAQYHYKLAAPTTWKQYVDIAQFFTGKRWANGRPGYGLVELSMRQNHLWSGFFSRVAAYAKYPSDPGFFFNPRTMQPRINNPGFVQGLIDYKADQKYGPPNMTALDWAGNAQTFVGGRAALDIQWGDIGPMSLNPQSSLVKGKVGYGMIPGQTRVWNPDTNRWVTFKTPNRAPFAGFGGWIFVVPKLTKHAAAALDLATYLGQPMVREDADVTPGSGINPDAVGALNNIGMWVKSGFTRPDAIAYTNSIKASLKNPNLVFDLRIPGINEYKDALETELSKALAGQESPKAALDKAAGEWNAITNRLGRARQLRYYRQSLGLPTR